MNKDDADITVVFCKCGRPIFLAATSYLERKDKNEIGRMVADGCTVQHMPAVEARKVDFGCACTAA